MLLWAITIVVTGMNLVLTAYNYQLFKRTRDLAAQALRDKEARFWTTVGSTATPYEARDLRG